MFRVRVTVRGLGLGLLLGFVLYGSVRVRVNV